MDYSENYSCSYQDEPQQAFYNQSQVTFHPMMVHYKDTEGDLKHQSFVGISPKKSHSTPTTLAFIRKLVSLIKNILSELSTIHTILVTPLWCSTATRVLLKLLRSTTNIFVGFNAVGII